MFFSAAKIELFLIARTKNQDCKNQDAAQAGLIVVLHADLTA
jgi:hypothetical protein